MRRMLWLPTLLSCLAWTARGDAAAILYRTTDLGADQLRLPNADGSYSSVTGAAGTAYAFSKAAVTPIDVQLPSESLSSQGGDYAKSHLTMQSGAFQVGTKEVHDPPQGIFVVPSFQTPTGMRNGFGGLGDLNDAWIGADANGTVRDLNVLGHAVGAGLVQPGKSSATYAAFSAPGLVGHGGYAPTVDNLNNYIAPLPAGISLTSALKIDDLGRIIALGSDNHDYLLTPTALGDAATVPEPTTLATVCVLGITLWIRARGRQARGLEGEDC
jgi:hypothetical protein